MSLTIVSKKTGPVGNDHRIQARVVAPDATGQRTIGEGNAINSEDISSITCRVFDITVNPDVDGAPQGDPTSAPAIDATAFSDELVTDDEWYEDGHTVDDTGRNFLFKVAGPNFPAAHRYRIVIDVETTGGTITRWAHEYWAQSLTGPG